MRRLLGYVLFAIVLVILIKVFFAAIRLGFMLLLLLLVVGGANYLLNRKR